MSADVDFDEAETAPFCRVPLGWIWSAEARYRGLGAGTGER